MKFKEGDRVHVLRFLREEVDFYATMKIANDRIGILTNCTDAKFTGRLIALPTHLAFGEDRRDYYVLTGDEPTLRWSDGSSADGEIYRDEEDTEEPVIQHINDMYNEVPKEKEQKQKVELKKQYIIEVKKGLYVDYVDSKEAFYFTKDITKACVFKNREYPTKFAEIIDAKILEIKRYVEV